MKHRILFVIFILISILYSPSWGNYFSGDDWYHLRLVQIQNWREFLNFFSFTPTDQTASFYRPLSTQLFFFIFYQLFGLWALPWYVFTTVMLGISVCVVYLVAKNLFINLKLGAQRETSTLVGSETVFAISSEKMKGNFALVSALIYGISVTHFTHQYFLSTFQEIGMVIGVLAAFLSYLRGERWRTLFWWIVALLCKETAVMFFGLIGIYEFCVVRNLSLTIKHISRNVSLLLVLMVYLYLRLGVFVQVGGDSYQWDFSPVRAMNTLFWYVVWSIGVPEMVVDFIGSGLSPIPRFYTAFGYWWILVVIGFFVNLIVIFLNFQFLIFNQISPIHILKRIHVLPRFFNRESLTFILFCGVWFLMGLLPVVFLPWHKFSLELGLPMVGFALFLGWMAIRNGRLGKLLLITFVLFNILMNRLTYIHHYSVNRSLLAEKTVHYFLTNYPVWPIQQVWITDDSSEDMGEWGGEAVQISHSVNRSEMFRVVYQNKDIDVYFEGVDDESLQGNDFVSVQARDILND